MKRLVQQRWLIYLLALLMITWQNFMNLASESLWYDEAYTWWVSSQLSFGESIASSIYEIIPPGSYVLWRIWIALTGETEFAMRALSALLGVITAAALTRTTHRLTGRIAPAIFTVMAAMMSPVLLWANREVRMYGPLICMCVLSSMALMEVLFGSKRRNLWLALWTVFSLVSLYMAITAAFWLLAQVIFAGMIFTLRAREQKSWGPFQHALRVFFLPVLAIAVGFLPWVIAAIPSLGINTGYWPSTLTMGAFLKTAIKGMTTHQFSVSEISRLGVDNVIVFGFALITVMFGPVKPRAKLYILAGVIALLIQGMVYRNTPQWELRHATLYAPFILMALSYCAPREEELLEPEPYFKFGYVHLIFVFVTPILFFGSTQIVNGRHPYHEDWRAAAAYVQENRQPGDVVIIETGSVYPAWVYYAGDAGIFPLPDEQLLNVYNVLNYTNIAPVLEQATQDASQVWLVTWLDHVTDPTAIVPMLLDQQGSEVKTPDDIYGLGLRQFVLDDKQAMPEFPLHSVQVDAELLPDLTLWGYTLPDTPIASDSDLDVLTWWSTSNPDTHTGKFYQASLRLVDARGYTWLQYDIPPGGEDYRPERWEPGTLVLGQFDTHVPRGLVPGQYELKLIVYDDSQNAEITLGSLDIIKGEPAPNWMNDFERVPWDYDTAITVSGIRLNQDVVQPGGIVSGEIFWEVRSPVEADYDYVVAVGSDVTSRESLMPDGEFTWQTGDLFRTAFEVPVNSGAIGTKVNVVILLYEGGRDAIQFFTLPVTIENDAVIIWERGE